MKKGIIVPSEITCNLLNEEFTKNESNFEYFLIDGFPRNLENFQGYEKYMASTTRVLANIVLDINRVFIK